MSWSGADVFDALIAERVYKKGFSYEKAMDIITGGAGTHLIRSWWKRLRTFPEACTMRERGLHPKLKRRLKKIKYFIIFACAKKPG